MAIKIKDPSKLAAFRNGAFDLSDTPTNKDSKVKHDEEPISQDKNEQNLTPKTPKVKNKKSSLQVNENSYFASKLKASPQKKTVAHRISEEIDTELNRLSSELTASLKVRITKSDIVEDAVAFYIKNAGWKQKDDE